MAGEEESASNPFSLFDRLYEAGQKVKKVVSDTGVGIDRHQVERMEEHRATARAKGYVPGARPRGKRRPNNGRIVRGSMENPGAE
jgi:hypothetical protein